jgi:hypothetical protein
MLPGDLLASSSQRTLTSFRVASKMCETSTVEQPDDSAVIAVLLHQRKQLSSTDAATHLVDLGDHDVGSGIGDGRWYGIVSPDGVVSPFPLTMCSKQVAANQ